MKTHSRGEITTALNAYRDPSGDRHNFVSNFITGCHYTELKGRFKWSEGYS